MYLSTVFLFLGVIIEGGLYPEERFFVAFVCHPKKESLNIVALLGSGCLPCTVVRYME